MQIVIKIYCSKNYPNIRSSKEKNKNFKNKYIKQNAKSNKN